MEIYYNNILEPYAGCVTVLIITFLMRFLIIFKLFEQPAVE